jgi:hypothetical protein
MEFMAMVFGFVLCVCAMGMYTGYRTKQLSVMAKAHEFDQGAVQKELAQIKQRLAVLNWLL